VGIVTSATEADAEAYRDHALSLLEGTGRQFVVIGKVTTIFVDDRVTAEWVTMVLGGRRIAVKGG
jgi:hypothetical protein